VEGRREWPFSVVFAIVVWMLLFFPQLFMGEMCTLGDASAFRPFAEFSRARWHEQGVRTYWNPYTFMGTEAVASLSDSRPQYLPTLVLKWVERLSQPRMSPQFWLLLAHLLGTLSIMVLARRLWVARGVAALCGGLIWLLSVPILLPFAFGHDAQLLADTLIPVAILFTHQLLSASAGQRRLLPMLGLSATFAIQILHGHPQIVVYASMFLVAFAVQQALAERTYARLVWVAAGAGLGLALSMAVWWPALLYSAQSFRGGGETPGLSLLEVAKFSPGWRDLASLVWPRAVGFGGPTYWGAMLATDYSPYLGAVAVALAFLGLKGGSAHRSTGLLLGCTVGLAVLLSLGTTLGPLFGVIRDLVPLWSKFRVPFYLLVLASFSLALLAARGAARITPASVLLAPRAVRLLAAAAVLGAVVGLALVIGPLQALYANHAQQLKSTLSASAGLTAARAAGIDLLLRLALVGAAILIALSSRLRRSPAAVWLLPFLIVVDLGGVAYPELSRSTGPPAAVHAPRPTPLAEVTAADPRQRAYVGVPGLLEGRYFESYTNFWVSWRARCLTGLAGAPPASWRAVMAFDLVRRQAVLRAWGVGYLDLPAGVAADTTMLRPLLERDGLRAYAFRNSSGRAYAVRRVLALPSEDAMAETMAIRGFDPTHTAVTTNADAAGEYPGSEHCVIRWLEDEPEKLVLEVDAPDRAFVVVADSYFPGWSAAIDGRAAEINPTNLLVRGVAMPSGRHRLEMRYETSGMRAGVQTTRTAGLVWGLLFVLALVLESRRRSRAPA
jgi:hypothetical protein